MRTQELPEEIRGPAFSPHDVLGPTGDSMGKQGAAIALTVMLPFAVAIPQASAGPATDALSTCLADSTTGKDRKELARWVYAGMSAHPEIRGLSNVSGDVRDGFDRRMAEILTRLLTESCSSQAARALEEDGAASFEIAFGSIGKLAMQELMSDADVKAAFGGYQKYVDPARFEAAFPRGK